MKCNNCGNEIEECICKVVDMKWSDYQNGNIESFITQNSTGQNTLFAYSEYTGNPIVINSKNELFNFTQKGEINPQKLFITQSTHKGFLKYAKKHLTDMILNNPYPALSDKEIVILLAGAALNKQIDKDITVKSIKGDYIIKKLREVNKNAKEKYENRLLDDYKVLNKYYNSTKHEKDDEKQKYENYLSTPEGRYITIHFFETVRRMFVWYYENFSKTGVPCWDELKEINYNNYGVSYDFFSYSLTFL